MKHASLASFAIIITIAVFFSVWISHKNMKEIEIQTLLSSSSTIDQLSGIEKVKNESFASLVTRLTHLLGDDPEVTTSASKALVLMAFRESCVDKLETLQIDQALFEAAKWWESARTEVSYKLNQTDLACDIEAAPWLRRLASLHCEALEEKCIDSLITMPLRDRNSSVLLATLAIDKHIEVDEKQLLITSWQRSIDSDQRKIALLLQGMANLPIESLDSEPQIQTLATILREKNASLAWRTLHQADGLIDPDFALAGLIADRNWFMQILIRTACENRWQHPEHAVELARSFAPDIIRVIPDSLLAKGETRKQWWNLVSCGLLLEQR